MNDKKKFKDTKVGKFLADKAPDIISGVGDLIPDAGILSVVAKAVGGSDMSAEDKLEFERLAAGFQLELQRQVTARWEADATTKFWLPNNIRPLTLIALTVVTLTFIGIDAAGGIDFTLGEGHLDLLQYLTMTAFGAYFAGRSVEKIRK